VDREELENPCRAEVTYLLEYPSEKWMGVGADLCNQEVGYLTQGLRMVCFLKVNLGDLNALSDEQFVG
jgi:hypothetical protein